VHTRRYNFFECLLLPSAGVRVIRARHQLSPSLPSQQAIHRTLSNSCPDLFFLGATERAGLDCSPLAGEGGEHREPLCLLFLGPQGLSSSATPYADQGRGAVVQVARRQMMDGANRPAQRGRHRRGRKLEGGPQPQAEGSLLVGWGGGTLQQPGQFTDGSWQQGLWSAQDRLLVFPLAFLIV
jgi:hypothetical protein